MFNPKPQTGHTTKGKRNVFPLLFYDGERIKSRTGIIVFLYLNTHIKTDDSHPRYRYLWRGQKMSAHSRGCECALSGLRARTLGPESARS